MRRLTKEDFIERATKVHKGTYDYSMSEYKNNRSEVVIICKVHGKFVQIAANHLNGHRCPECFPKKTKGSTEKFVEKASKVHDNEYTYDLAEYVNSKTKVRIICKVHGIFEQTPNNHLSGNKCPSCRKEKSTVERDTKGFIHKAKKIHEKKYGYAKTRYLSAHRKVIITCREHGDFEQKPNNHLNGQGCPVCANQIRDNAKRHTKEQFVEKARKVHGDKYGYEQVKYLNSHKKIRIVCPEHGVFTQKPYAHHQGQGCIRCSTTGPSEKEREIYELFPKNIEVNTSDRVLLEGRELDIYIPEKNLAIEFNGLYWHSDKFKDKLYHLDKTLECRKRGIRLVHIFEDEWDNKKEIVESRLRNLIGNSKRVYARKCTVKEVETKEKSEFLDKNHIQGKVGSKVNLGLYHNGELVSLMTFGKLRKNLGSSHREGHWELLRFCNKLGISVTGGAGKILSHFKKNYTWKEIISYADLRWSQGNLYEKLGFDKVWETPPNYFYVKEGKTERLPRFKYRKSELLKWGWGVEEQTEKEIMEEKGFMRIYDCGTIKFVKKI